MFTIKHNKTLVVSPFGAWTLSAPHNLALCGLNGIDQVNEIDTKICGNILDALDRLFDRESEVIDIYALIFASNVALKGSISELDLTNIAIALDKIARNGKTEDLQHEEALQITNKLRVALNDLLPI